MDTTQQPPAVLSLCPGMCGLERGLERAIGRIRTVAYVEIEAWVIWNLVKKMEQGLLDPAPVHSNVNTFADIAASFRGKVDIITAGYPCQPFSIAGQRKGATDPRHLYPYIQKIVRAIMPPICFFENVDDHLTLGFDEVYRSLADMGYTVEAGIFSAEEVGAPHARERLIILGVLGNAPSLGEMRLPVCEPGQERQAAGYSPHPARPGETELANCSCQGLQSTKWAETLCREGAAACGPACQCGNTDRWPARPGQPQYEWEAPRTLPPFPRLPAAIHKMGRRLWKNYKKSLPSEVWQELEHIQKAAIKSRLGTTINGYNHREDLLRLAGNAVVEQTAELAWKTLWGKIIS